MNIKAPYLVFLGDALDYKQAKTAFGLAEWRPELCLGQLKLTESTIDVGLSNMTVKRAVEAGAKTFIIGISPSTTDLPTSYVDTVLEAIGAGLDIANPLHSGLGTIIEDAARTAGVTIHNFRHRAQTFSKGNGLKREGLRLLTIGTDCACGKKYTALSITKALQRKNVKSTFRSTGQTGFLISGSGINNDTIQADFLSGAAEWLTPTNDKDHWDIVEGQGSLSHPSFGAGSLSLLHGTQPDIIVLCHEPGRVTQRGVTTEVRPLKEEVDLALSIAKRTNPNVRLGAISLFTRYCNDTAALREYEDSIRLSFSVPVFDPSIESLDFQQFINTLSDYAGVS